jgi:formate C-acetyltransferase
MNGLTAALHSAAAAGKALVSDGSTLTLTLSPGLLKDEESIDKLISLIQGYFRLGGRQVQFTPVDTETLLDAQAHPEKYPDLSVKVSGYSAIFVDLPKSLQDDIIARTEFREV